MAQPESFRQILNMPVSPAPSTADSVLIIIDAQNEYAYGRLAITPANLAYSRPAIHSLLERYRAAGAPIMHVVHIVPPSAAAFTPDTPLAAEFDELLPLPALLESGQEVMVPKRFPGSFAETVLRAELQKTGKTKIVLVGYMAHVCVSTTAREGHQLGYDVFLVEDAIGDRNIPGAEGEAVKEMVLHELADTFGTVVKSSQIN